MCVCLVCDRVPFGFLRSKIDKDRRSAADEIKLTLVNRVADGRLYTSQSIERPISRARGLLSRSRDSAGSFSEVTRRAHIAYYWKIYEFGL